MSLDLGAAAAVLELPYVTRAESLARHTTMRVGGPAAIWAQPDTIEEVAELLRRVHTAGLPLFVLGVGSNLVVADTGFDGVVLHLGKGFETSRVEGPILTAGGAAYLPKLTKFALDHHLGNLEWACGVPGSLGGSLWGNAGARGFNGQDVEGRDCAADFANCLAFERDGTARRLGRGDVEFGYRRSNLGSLIVVEASFALKPLTPEAVKRHREAVRDLLERRRATQPANAASAGCIWKNPAGCAGAGALVEAAGLKGASHHGAEVSTVHGNFVINAGGATARDLMELIERVEHAVLEGTGIQLEREARFLGW